MHNGNILCSIPIITEKPVPFLPKIFYYIHTIADNPEYYSKGRLRAAEVHCVFHYTLRGMGECSFNNKTQKVLPGQGFIQVINDPGSGYSYPQNGTEEWEFVCFCFEGGNSIQIINELINNYGCVYTISKESPIMKELLNEEKWIENSLLSSFDSSRCFYLLYLELIESVSHSFDLLNNQIISEIKEIVADKIYQCPTINEISELINISREHLSRIFHTYTGKTLKTYIIQQQLIQSCNLLINTNMTIKQIALKMSFSSSTNFIRFFKENMHVTPEKFRKTGTIPFF